MNNPGGLESWGREASTGPQEAIRNEDACNAFSFLSLSAVMTGDTIFNIMKVYMFLIENVQNKDYSKQSGVGWGACSASTDERDRRSVNVKPTWATQDPVFKHLQRKKERTIQRRKLKEQAS